jgi:hypothetical protein
VLLMTPNVGEVKVLSGLANCGWFSVVQFSAKLKAACFAGPFDRYRL